MNAGKPEMRWAVSVIWRDSLLPNDAELSEWVTEIGGGRVLLPVVPAPAGCLNVLTARVVVEARSLRQATTAGLARVEKAVRCKAFDVRATLIRTGDRDEEVFATHSCGPAVGLSA